MYMTLCYVLRRSSEWDSDDEVPDDEGQGHSFLLVSQALKGLASLPVCQTSERRSRDLGSGPPETHQLRLTTRTSRQLTLGL